MALAAGRAFLRVGLGGAANELLEFASAIFTLIFVDGHVLLSYNYRPNCSGGTCSITAPYLRNFAVNAAVLLACTGLFERMAILAATPAAWPMIMYCGSIRSDE